MENKEEFKILNVDFECSKCKKADSAVKKIPVSRVIEKLDSFFSTNDLSGALRLLEYWQNEAVSANDNKGELSIVNEMLGLSRRISNREKGEKAIIRAEELIMLTRSDNTVSGATVLLNAATTSKAFGNLEKAVSLYERAYKIYKRKLEPSDLRFAAFYNNYATTLVDLEQFDKACAMYNKAIEITGKSQEGLLDSAVSYVNLAHLYEKKEGLESPNIEICLNKAESILESDRVQRNSYYAFVAEKCAPSFDYFGFFFFAEQLYKRSREIYEGN